MTDIIKNGSFEEGTIVGNGLFGGDAYKPANWNVPTPAFCTKESETCDKDTENLASVKLVSSNWNTEYGSFGIPSGIPPISIQQGIDLTSYNSILVLNINFNHSLAYGSSRLEGSFDVYLYKATSYDSKKGTYTYEGEYSDYIYKNTYKMSKKDSYDMCWQESNFVVSNLTPGYYILVFATPVVQNEQTGLPDDSYNFVLDKVSGTVVETVQQNILYHNIIKNGSFETHNGLDFYYWHYDGAKVAPERVDYHGNVNDLLGTYVCSAKTIDYTNLETAKANNYGLKQIFDISSYCNMEIALSFKQYTQYPIALSIYEVTSYVSDSNYTIKSTPYFQTDIASDSPADREYSDWTFFSRVIGAVPSKYLLVIHPSSRTAIIDNVQINIFTKQNTTHDGSFENPYTLEDGRFTPAMDDFIPYNTDAGYLDGFIYHNGEYYYNAHEISGLRGLALNTIVDNRYYYPSGKMARNESFIFNHKLYTVDSNGYIAFETNAVLDIVPYYDINMQYPVQSLDLIVESVEQFYVYYMTQSTDITINVTSSDSNVVFCSGITPGKDCNLIALTGRNPGSAIVTMSYTNLDGSVISKDIRVTVLPNTSEYVDVTAIYLVRDEIGILLGGKHKLEYEIIPDAEVELALNWISTNESVATVDKNGVVTAKGLGSCKVYMMNYRLNTAHSCDVYVLESSNEPKSIKISGTQTNIKVGETISTPHYEFCDYNGNSYTVNQDGVWTSKTPTVADINSYGRIVGKSVGRAIIELRTPQNTSIVGKHIVNVMESDAPIEDIELDIYEATLSESSIYGYLNIGYRVIPEHTSQNQVVWSSSNPSLATVSTSGVVALTKNAIGKHTVEITCTSVSNPSIVRTCVINIDSSKRYPFAVKSFDKQTETNVDTPVEIKYEVDNCFTHSVWDKFRYDVSVIRADGSPVSRALYSMNHVENSSITFSAYLKGDYVIKLSCNYIQDVSGNTYNYGEEYFYVSVKDKGEINLTFTEGPESLFGLSNGNYILKCLVRDNSDRALAFELNIGDGNGWRQVYEENLLYQGKVCNYIFGSGLSAGTYTVQLRVSDIKGNSNTSNSFTLVIPDTTSSKRNALELAKTQYELVENDLIDCLRTIVIDRKLYDKEELEFRTRYKLYCPNYYNLKYVLEDCIAYINTQIENSQYEIAKISHELSSDGIVDFEREEQTNASYQNVTNMDYYQNECIKQLMTRVLELETRLNELTNNNN